MAEGNRSHRCICVDDQSSVPAVTLAVGTERGEVFLVDASADQILSSTATGPPVMITQSSSVSMKRLQADLDTAVNRLCSCEPRVCALFTVDSNGRPCLPPSENVLEATSKPGQTVEDASIPIPRNFQVELYFRKETLQHLC